MKKEQVPSSSEKPAGTILDWPAKAGCVADLSREVWQLRRQRKKSSRRATAASCVLLVGLFSLLWAVPYFRQTSTLSVPASRRENFRLPDSSIAELNARTALQTDFRYGRRTVRLQSGEAFFTVAKDPSHPFLVVTPSGTVRVTGTQFNVRVGDHSSEVTLLEGKVLLEMAGSPVALAPGQDFDTGHPGLRTLSPSELSNVAAWRSGQLSLDGLTLGEAMARLARYHGREIQVAPELASLRPGGRIPLDNLAAALASIESALSVRAVQIDTGYRIIPK